MLHLKEKLTGSHGLLKEKDKLAVKRPHKKNALLLIGAKNPYAVAFERAGTETPKWEEQHPAEIRKGLANIIGDGLKYEQLFDPLYGSCLFCPDTVKKIQASISKEWLEELGGVIPTGTNAAGAAPGGTDCIKKWGTLTSPRWFTTNPGSQLGKDDPDFTDPVQWGSNDCYFIAAISSIAWIHDDTANPAAKINTSAVLPIKLYPRPENPCIGARQPVAGSPDAQNFILMTLQMPLDVAGNPACARSSEYGISKEYWPTFYEKAYARYRLAKGHIRNWETTHGKVPTYDDHPDIGTLPCGDPFETLTLLTNIPCSIYDMRTNPNCPRDPGIIWGKLTGVCYTYEGNPSRKIKYPAVAITNCTKDPLVPPTLTPPYPVCAAKAGSGVVYDEELLVASHAYSLLGIHETAAGRYVILRNPYGTNWGFIMGSQTYRLAGASIPPGSLDFHVPTNGQTPYNFSWPLFVQNSTTGKWTPNCGIFAMHCDDFAKWFGAFGWVLV